MIHFNRVEPIIIRHSRCMDSAQLISVVQLCGDCIDRACSTDYRQNFDDHSPCADLTSLKLRARRG